MARKKISESAEQRNIDRIGYALMRIIDILGSSWTAEDSCPDYVLSALDECGQSCYAALSESARAGLLAMVDPDEAIAELEREQKKVFDPEDSKDASAISE